MFGGLKNRKLLSSAAVPLSALPPPVPSDKEEEEIIAAPPPPSSPPYYPDAQSTYEEDSPSPPRTSRLSLFPFDDDDEEYHPPSPSPPSSNRRVVPFHFSSSEDEEEDNKRTKQQPAPPTTNHEPPKLRLKSSTMSTTQLRQRARKQVRTQRVKIENLGGEGGFRVHLYFWNTKRHPVLASMDQARDVLEWYTKTRYIGVRPLDQQDQEQQPRFTCYFIFNGEVCHLNRYVFATAELAARRHDKLARDNQLAYRKNFRVVRKPIARRERPRAAHDFRYLAQSAEHQRLGFIDENMRLMRRLIPRLAAAAAAAAAAADSGQVWEALQQAVKLVANWNADRVTLRSDLTVALVRLGEASKLLELAWRVGDRLLLLQQEEDGRLAWSRGVFQIVVELLDQVQRRRSSAADRMCELFSWAVAGPLTVEFGLLQLKKKKKAKKTTTDNLSWSDDDEEEDGMDDFRLKLERYDEIKHWTRDAAFHHLQGTLAQHTARQRNTYAAEEHLQQAQRHFADALELDKQHCASLAALAQVEMDIQRVHERTMGGDTIQSLSQRSAQSQSQSQSSYSINAVDSQYNISSSSESEEEEEDAGNKRRRRTLVGARPSLAATGSGSGSGAGGGGGASAAKVDALDVLQTLAKERPGYPPLMDAWSKLVFYNNNNGEDGEDSGNVDAAVAEEQRQTLLRWFQCDGTVTGGAVSKARALWRLSLRGGGGDQQPQAQRVQVLARCLLAVCDSLERVTQRECPTFSSHFNACTVPMWEILVAGLQLVPQDTVVFSPDRQALWQSRFFPHNQVGAAGLVDPLRFDAKHWITPKRSGSKMDADQYLTALKSIVAHMLLVSPAFHGEVVRRLGQEYVNNTAVDQACRACGLV